jgi:hypothetical protein
MSDPFASQKAPQIFLIAAKKRTPNLGLPQEMKRFP